MASTPTTTPTTPPPSNASAVELAALLAVFFRRLGIAKSAAAALATIVVATLTVSTAWSAKASHADLEKHVAHGEAVKGAIDARLATLELKTTKLEAMQQVAIDQVVYSRDRLDVFLLGRGLPPGVPPPAVPVFTPIAATHPTPAPTSPVP